MKLSADGQIPVPQSIRDALGLAEGTELELELKDGDLVISKYYDWRKLRGILAGGPDPVEALKESRREDREREDADI